MCLLYTANGIVKGADENFLFSFSLPPEYKQRFNLEHQSALVHCIVHLGCPSFDFVSVSLSVFRISSFTPSSNVHLLFYPVLT
jgi:hypothetical protein